MKILYIPRPHKMGSALETFLHVKRSEYAAMRVWEAGHVALCPQKNSALFDDAVSSEDNFIVGDFQLLLRCDGIVVIDGTEESEKTKRELEFAIEHNILIYSEFEF